MKKLICIAALLIGGLPATAQIHRGQVDVIAKEFRQNGDSVHVTMTFRIAEFVLERRSSFELAPVIESTGEQKQSLRLPGVNINGSIRHKMREREMRLSGLTSSDFGYYAEVSDKSNTSLEYRWTGVYQPWMAGARLGLNEELTGCGGVVQRIEVRLLAANIALETRVEPYTPVLTAAYITPAVEEVKRRAVSGHAALTFPVSRTEILPELGNNPAELTKIRELIEGVRNSRGVTISRIDIIGWASPEGSLANNKRLSEGRAASLRNYISSRYNDLSRNLFNVEFGGENWDGLRKALDALDYDYKNEVIAIMNLPLGEDAKETRLKSLRGGAPYRQLLAEIFPNLRRVEMVVDYNVSNFTVEEARDVFRTNPENLSLNELFILANSYGQGTPEFNEVMAAAARIFPADETANLNAAAAALGRGDAAGAGAYLSKVAVRNAEYNNNLGVLSMLRGEWSAARGYFTAAIQAGFTQASANLSELDKKEENLRRIEEQNRKLGISGDNR